MGIRLATAIAVVHYPDVLARRHKYRAIDVDVLLHLWRAGIQRLLILSWIPVIDKVSKRAVRLLWDSGWFSWHGPRNGDLRIGSRRYL